MTLKSIALTLSLTAMSALFAAPVLAQDATDLPARITDYVLTPAPGDHILGSESAVQTMIVYASVTCPHCGDWFSKEWPDVKKGLIETGKMRFVFREYPTAPAALAMTGFLMAECAPSTEYFDVIEYQMENQKRIFADVEAGQGRETYNKIAAMAGMETEDAIKACLGNPDMLAHIQDNSQRADLGEVRGVPAFFINGDSYSGKQDAQTLIDLITDMDDKGLTALPAELSMAEDHSGHAHD